LTSSIYRKDAKDAKKGKEVSHRISQKNTERAVGTEKEKKSRRSFDLAQGDNIKFLVVLHLYWRIASG
jgi:hypothetical protein